MLRGETTKRSDLAADTLTAKLQAHGVDRLRGASSIWVIFDGSDLRKPSAAAMECLQRVRTLDGRLVNGYATLNAIGLGPDGQRGLLYHHLFSSAAPDFVSEPREVRTAIRSVGQALAPLAADVTAIVDSGFDDVAVWAEIWNQEMQLVCRVQHRDRLVRPQSDAPVCHLADLAPRLRRLAQLEATMVVQKRGQPRPKLQPVTVTVAATPVVITYRPATRSSEPGAEQDRPCWFVEARLDRVRSEPWWLLTDRPVETAEQATAIFRMYCERWAIEDAFKTAKTCLGWEDVQLLAFDAVRLLVALGWVAAGFLFELGVTLEWPEVRLLRRLGGGEDRPTRPPGKIALTQGLRRLLDYLALTVMLTEEQRQHGLPPRIAAMLGWSEHP